MRKDILNRLELNEKYNEKYKVSVDKCTDEVKIGPYFIKSPYDVRRISHYIEPTVVDPERIQDGLWLVENGLIEAKELADRWNVPYKPSLFKRIKEFFWIYFIWDKEKDFWIGTFECVNETLSFQFTNEYGTWAAIQQHCDLDTGLIGIGSDRFAVLDDVKEQVREVYGDFKSYKREQI